MGDGVPATAPIWDQIIDCLKRADEECTSLRAELDQARGQLGDLAQRVAVLEKQARA
jgi:hypothetical protein